MKITINNIGAINSATIHLDSLTVIAGENDSGKSTIGKVLFALVQAYSRFPLAVGRARRAQVKKSVERLYFTLRQSQELDSPLIQETIELLRNAERFDNSIPAPIVIALAKMAMSLKNISPSKKIELDKIINELNDDFSDRDEIGKYIYKALQSEFSKNIINKTLEQDLVGDIILFDEEDEILNIKFSDKKVISSKSEKVFKINDATLLEGPAIIQYFAAMSGFNEIGEKRMMIRGGALPYHVVDLAGKLRNVKDNKSLIEKNEITDLEKMIHGKMKYDARDVDFNFYKNNVKIPSGNVSSGVKALSIISMLISGDYIKRGSMLILDEPETNLHPSWQIAYARLIADLSKNGVKVLVASHSPYMVEALKMYSENGAKFYLAHRNTSGNIVYSDTNGDITSIISALAKPLAGLMSDGGDDEFWG